jgi:hypothetical protein
MVDGDNPSVAPGEVLEVVAPGEALIVVAPGEALIFVAPGEALIVVASGCLVAPGEAELVGVAVSALADTEAGPPDNGAEVGAAEDGAGTGAVGELAVVSMGVGFSSGSFSLRDTGIWRPRATP